MMLQRAHSAILLATALALATYALSPNAAEDNAAASGPTNAEISNLQGQIRSMERQLDTLGNAQGTQSQQRLMQQNWQSMLDYMRGMQSMPWMMNGREQMGPGMMGRGMMGRRMMERGMRGRGMMERGDGGWMIGCPMIGGADGGWQLPPDMNAGQYRSDMLQNMQRMQEQMAQIQSTTNPAERRRLLQQHWQDMYRNMQTMRGMGWMWDGATPDAESADRPPEAASRGARLVNRYCTQCHAQPSPKLHTASEWKAVTSRMKMNMQNLRRSNWRSVRVPSDAEMKSILDYLQKFAR